MAHPTSRPRKTVEDYLALPDDVRAELIAGELLVTPSPTFDHQRIATELCRLLGNHITDADLGVVLAAPLDVHLPSGDVVQPDVLFIRREHHDIAQDWIRGAPDLVVEIVSASSVERDRFVKRELYARNGVPAYWIVDAGERSIEVLGLQGGAYVSEAWFRDDAELTSASLPGLRIPLAPLFG